MEIKENKNMYNKMMAGQLAMGISKILFHGMQNAHAISDHVECAGDKRQTIVKELVVQTNSISGDNIKM